MFKKLRNRLILTNMGITSIVIIITFTTIYFTSVRAARLRPTPQSASYNSEIELFIEERIREEQAAAAGDLLISLLISGALIEVAVAIVSYLVAEEAIKPIKEAYGAQKVFIANASHEIKTPLAAISANLEAAEIKDNQWIRNVEMETEKLAALNKGLLDLARTDLVTESTSQKVQVGELVEEALKGFEPRMQGTRLEKRIKNREAQINRDDFLQIFSILMDNAIKYSEQKIIVKLSEKELVVANDGAKIKKKDLPHVFERFYQGDKSSDGVGLGLAIAKVTAGRNHWELLAKSNKMTSFILKF